MRARVSLCLLLLMAVVRAIAQGTAGSSVSDAPQFVRSLHDPTDLTGKFLPEPLVSAARNAGLDLQALRGRPVVISYWSTWCERCTMGLTDIEKLGDSGLITPVAIDFDRDPEKAKAYLSKHHFAWRNIHDDGRLRAAVRNLLMPPYAMNIVLDANGRVVFAQWNIYREELRAAIASLGPQYADAARGATVSRPENAEDLPPEKVREAATSAMHHEADYLSEQRQFVCQYDVKTLKDYGSGMSTSSVQHLEEVRAADSGRILTRVVSSGQSGPPDPDARAASESFAVWKDPILSSVIEHSLISNVRVTATNASGDRFVYFTVRGDPAYRPESEIDQVAQSLEGFMQVELNHNVLEMVDGTTSYDVIDATRFVAEREIPVLSFRAVPYKGTFLPSIWSETTFAPVANGARARQQWQDTLVRTFGQRQGCKQFEVNSTILPGVTVVPDAAKH
jgi:thiol-disulfide isomerase/thioredoxin